MGRRDSLNGVPLAYKPVLQTDSLLLEVCVLGNAVICHIPDALQLRNSFDQSFLDTVFQSQIHCTAALATTTKLQNSNILINLNQRNNTTVGSQPGLISVCRK